MQNSSSATLNLPVGSNIQWAGLYWGGIYNSTNSGITNPTELDINQVKLKIPGASSYTTSNSEICNIESAEFSGWNSFLSYADVTSIVQSSGTGDYFVTGSGFTGPYGGWNLVVIYEDATEKSGNIAV